MLLSIITINFNNKKGLEDTVKSVIAQSYKSFEYLIIDGGSSDGSAAFIAEKAEHLSYWISEKDSGIYNAMNKGIKAAKGDYLLFLNSGDQLHDAEVLGDISQYLETKKDIYYGDLLLQYEHKSVVKQFPDTLSFSFFFHRGYLPHPATFIRKSLFEDIGVYNEDYKLAADWDFLVNAICKYNRTYEHMTRTVSIFDKNGVSNNPENTNVLAKEKALILSQNFPLFEADTQRLLDYAQYFKNDRFKLLRALEAKAWARKLNTIWLKFMSTVFR